MNGEQPCNQCDALPFNTMSPKQCIQKCINMVEKIIQTIFIVYIFVVIVVNERSRHIDIVSMKAQLARAAEHDAALNVLYVPEISDFRGMHRDLLIEQLTSYHAL